jgi:hypothetical protein
MFPATVLVALLCGFHTSTVLLGAGISRLPHSRCRAWGIGVFIPVVLRIELQLYSSLFWYCSGEWGILSSTVYPRPMR